MEQEQNHSEQSKLQARAKNVKIFAPAFGLLLQNNDQQTFKRIKVGLKPYTIKQSLYNSVGQLTIIWQKLIFKASKDNQFIQSTFRQTTQIDELLNGLYNIYQKSSKKHNQLPKSNKSNKNSCSLMLCRVDYFKNLQQQFKIIQYNLTSTSFASHSQNFTRLQKIINQSSFQQKYKNFQQHNYPNNTPDSDIHRLLNNFIKQKTLMNNIVDHANILIKLVESGIQTERVCFCHLLPEITLKQGDLYYRGKLVSMVYWRTGLKLKDYYQNNNAEECWKVKQMIQISNCVKIPDIRIELMNMKKMQVQLSRLQNYRKYLNNNQCQILNRSLVFCTHLKLVQQNFQILKYIEEKGAQNFILKPNLQGGGNNIYGQQVYQMIRKLTIQQSKKYIIMQKIKTDSIQNVFYQNDVSLLESKKYMAQVSRYGILMEIDGQIKKNQSQGYLVRIKPQSANQTGVILGVGGLAYIQYQDQSNNQDKQQ